MELIRGPLLFLASFGALLALLMSATAAAIWAAGSFLRTVFGFPRALFEFHKRRREREALRASLLLLKRAGV